MYREIQIRVTPQDAADNDSILQNAARMAGIETKRIKHIDILRRSVDARQHNVFVNLTIALHIDKIEEKEKTFIPSWRDVSGAPPVIIVGAGPAGIFAALRLIERGYRPIILERGKAVEDRKKDLNQLYKTGSVNENSNFGFGEGGAGTFSDGKLYTRSNKRGNIQRTLEILVHHGANPVILIDSHPHIGTDKLPGVIINIRKTIETYGGEFRFNTRMTDLIIDSKSNIKGVVTDNGEIRADAVILATGHSARDVYRALNRQKVYLEPKDFAVGLRLEHPQHDIDCMRYHTTNGRGEYLPAAEYNFVENVEGKGVYSFCMCPGGIIVPAATAPGQQVVNGMSSSGRNTRWANSAVVTSIGEAELQALDYHGLFAGMDFQESLERKAWEMGGGRLYAPAQIMTDFLKKKQSGTLPGTSYKPGVTTSRIDEWLPETIYRRIAEGLRQFDRKSKGFISENALLLGVETRTSSPIRIPRDKEKYMHPEIIGLYPCGEGAGYAGGIISAAMDGEKCAENIYC